MRSMPPKTAPDSEPPRHVWPNSLGQTLCLLAQTLLLFASAWCVGLNVYPKTPPQAYVRLVLFALGFGCALLRGRPKYRARYHALSRGARIALLVFCTILSVVIMLGGHINFSGSYVGDLTQNYISSYSPWDLLAVLLQLPLLWEITTMAYVAMAGDTQPHPTASNPSDARGDAAVLPQTVCAVALALFVLWLPYLLAYWPGYLFGDSLNSLDQALNWAPLNNHYPIAFTLLVKACLWVGIRLFDSPTWGCALFSLVQMSLMALCLGYLVAWLVARTRLARPFLCAGIALFGCTPYVANYSIAMWKDPLFSCALVMLSLCLANLLIYARKGPSARSPHPWSLALCAVAMGLLRNNGLYIAVLVTLALVVWLSVRARKGHRGGTRATAPSEAVASVALLGVATILSWAVTGPLFTTLGYNTDGLEESAGIPLNQMARVVATKGSLTESDRAYMDQLLPLNEYKTVYAPCIVDSLKWNPDFNASALDSGLWGHWLSMGLGNPSAYFESWELQTAGYWALAIRGGVPSANIIIGVPRNTSADDAQELANYGISAKSLLPDGARDVLRQDEWSIPAGWVFWALVFVGIVLIGVGERSWLLVLLPGLGLFGTLFLASPIIYWPRYALAVQLLLPVYLLLPRIARVPQGRE